MFLGKAPSGDNLASDITSMVQVDLELLVSGHEVVECGFKRGTINDVPFEVRNIGVKRQALEDDDAQFRDRLLNANLR